MSLLRHRHTTLVTALALLAAIAAAALRAQQATFTGGSALVVVDVAAVDRSGQPITDLTADDFSVTFGGRPRAVQTLSLITSATGDRSAGASDVPGVRAAEARQIIIAVDEHSIPLGAQAAAREAVARVISRAGPDDRLALVTFPGGVAVGPTTDRTAIAEAVPRVTGRRIDAPRVRFGLSASEAMALKSREAVTVADIVNRECQREFTNPTCAQEVREAGGLIADALERQGVSTIDALHGLLDGVEAIPGPKVIFVISAGLPTTTVPGGRPNLTAATEAVSRRAAEADARLYVLYLNVHFLQHFSAATGWRSPSGIYQDSAVFGNGLERFAATAGGALFQVDVDAEPFIDRAFREASTFYRLGVRPERADADGKSRPIRVRVSRSGVTLRHRQVVTIPATAQPLAPSPARR
jgi:VWFA-related protein